MKSKVQDFSYTEGQKTCKIFKNGNFKTAWLIKKHSSIFSEEYRTEFSVLDH